MAVAQLDSRYGVPRESLRPDAPALGLRALVFAVGMAMPFISFLRERALITRSLVSRIELVDILCLLTIAALIVSRRIKISAALAAYGFTLVVGLGIGMGSGPPVFAYTEFAALSMAAVYLCLAVSIAPSPPLVKSLLSGLLVGAMIESTIVVHDYIFSSSQWFRTESGVRARGTFRHPYQLGNYGYTTAGIFLTFGWAYFRRWQTRALMVLTGGVAAWFVVGASRRAGMFALLAWVALYLLLGLRQVSRRSYLAVLALALVFLVIIANPNSAIRRSHLSDRFTAAVGTIASGRSYTYQQVANSMDNIRLWFPFGVGVGQGVWVVLNGEIHNTHLSVIVELGLLGLVTYYWVYFRPLFRSWDNSFGRYTQLVKLATVTFFLSSAIFMIHSRMNRDRNFMLFLGLAPTVAYAMAGEGTRRGPLVQTAFAPANRTAQRRR